MSPDHLGPVHEVPGADEAAGALGRDAVGEEGGAGEARHQPGLRQRGVPLHRGWVSSSHGVGQANNWGSSILTLAL